jgi:hypothetical protein
MTVGVFRFTFVPDIPLDEAEMTLQLATFAVEGLFGAARVHLDFSYHVDANRHAILADGTTEVGSAVVQVFTALLLREFDDDSFRVERVNSIPAPPVKAAA